MLMRTVVVLFGVFAAAGAAAQEKYPERPVEFIVPWGAGGGADQLARRLARLLEPELKISMPVINVPGATGSTGMTKMLSAPADGYAISVYIADTHALLATSKPRWDVSDFEPLGIMIRQPSALFVKYDSPFKNWADVVMAAKASPGKLKASGTGQGGIWHLALAGMLRDLGIESSAVPWVPSNGAGPALNDLAAGGVDIVTCSVPEARALIDAGRVRSLAVMSERPSTLYPNLPTVKAAIGSNWTVSAWRGVAAPKGLPKDIQDRLVAAIRKAHESREFRDFARQRGFGVVWAGPGEFARFMAKDDASMGEVMKALGLAR